MSTTFPGALDALTNPAGTDSQASPSHAGQHANANDAIEAIQAKLGADGVSYTFVPASGTAGTAINAAIAALPSSGGTIYLGAGTHVINTAVLLSKEVALRGVGMAATLLSFDASVVPTAIKMSDTTQRKIVISDLRINTTTGSANTGTAIDASYFFDSVIERVNIGSSSNQTPKIGVDFNALGTYYNTIDQCRISVGGASSIGVRGANNANDNSVRNTKISGDTSSTSVQLNTAHSWTLDKVSSDTANMAIGIDLQTGADDTTMIGCYLEGLAIGLKVASGVESVRYIGGYIASSVTANIQDNGAVGLTIDNTWVAFNPYSSLDRTGVVKSKVNGVNTPANQYQPDDFAGIITWDYDPVHIQAGVAAANGTVYLMRVKLRYAATITNVLLSVTAAGVTPVAGQTFVGLYDSSGTRVAVSNDAGTALTALGMATIPLTAPYAAAAGDYWIALVSNAATPPQLARASTLGLAGTFTLGSTAANRRYATNGAGATSLPASITPASNSASGLTFWAAAS